MPSLVFVKVGRVAEFPGAFLAFERSIASVNAHMYFQTTGTEESFVAVFTPVLFLTRVLQKV